MEAPFFQSTLINSIFTFIFFFIFVLIPTSYTQPDLGYTDCTSSFDCGNLKGISYPFWSRNSNRSQRCGEEGFELKCQQNQNPVISIGSLEFFVLDVIESRNLMTVARMEFWNSTCPENFVNTTLDNILFRETESENISFFYNCNISTAFSPHNFSCPGYGEKAVALYATDKLLRDGNLDVRDCQVSIQVPVSPAALRETAVLSELGGLKRVLRNGFNVSYSYKNEELCQQCVSSGGVCGTNTTSSSSFACHCNGEHPSPYVCLQQSKGSQGNVKWKVIIGVASGGLAMLITCTIIRNWSRIRAWGNDDSLSGPIGFCSGKQKGNQALEAFVRNYGHLAPTRYTFSEIKKMTNSFKLKLGHGGYGDVYKGTLLDGHLVAVKLLNASKGTGEEFINEVASISRTSHVNIVTLLGFCLEGDKRALVYEFMPNGSLEKFIFKKNKLKNHQKLGWKKLYEIAVGVAKGLEYLHSGCNTRIVHFDIKPTNVLLDDDFCPKISDFGLAKLCTRKESVVSMLHARGTIGYIAPEVFSRSFGGVSHKSDVYSYGMMVLEMVGGRGGEDFDGDDETTVGYFPQWVHKHLELEKEFEWPGVEETGEVEIVKKMSLVALWCIQTNPSERPSMSKVIEMMEGKSDALKVPPKPFLFSPEKSPPSYTSMNTNDHMVFNF